MHDTVITYDSAGNPDELPRAFNIPHLLMKLTIKLESDIFLGSLDVGMPAPTGE